MSNIEKSKKWDKTPKDSDKSLENPKEEASTAEEAQLRALDSDKSLENPKEEVSDFSSDKKDTASPSVQEKAKLTLSLEQTEERDLKNSSGKANNKSDTASKLEQELVKLKEALQKSMQDNLYLRAEFENFKRRSFEEQSKLIRYGGEQFIISLADEVLDDLDRAFSSVQEKGDFKSIKAGLSLIQKKLSQVLSDFGVHVIDPKGKVFDPSYQEALSSVKTSNTPEGYVVETFKKAYKLHDKVIRPAQVLLSEKGEKM